MIPEMTKNQLVGLIRGAGLDNLVAAAQSGDMDYMRHVGAWIQQASQFDTSDRVSKLVSDMVRGNMPMRDTVVQLVKEMDNADARLKYWKTLMDLESGTDYIHQMTHSDHLSLSFNHPSAAAYSKLLSESVPVQVEFDTAFLPVIYKIWTKGTYERLVPADLFFQGDIGPLDLEYITYRNVHPDELAGIGVEVDHSCTMKVMDRVYIFPDYKERIERETDGNVVVVGLIMISTATDDTSGCIAEIGVVKGLGACLINMELSAYGMTGDVTRDISAEYSDGAFLECITSHLQAWYSSQLLWRLPWLSRLTERFRVVKDRRKYVAGIKCVKLTRQLKHASLTTPMLQDLMKEEGYSLESGVFPPGYIHGHWQRNRAGQMIHMASREGKGDSAILNRLAEYERWAKGGKPNGSKTE